MTVSVTFSSTSGGQPESLPQYGGAVSPGQQSNVLDFYIWHDGTNYISNARFYMLPYAAGVYLGTETAQDDYDKIIGWGDDSGAGSSSGIQ
jgi:hypothetical protein